MPELPTGTVTFLFTDVEGSTRLWEHYPAAMRRALARHDTLIEDVVAEHGGVLVRPRGEGDSRFAVFARATDAVAAAAALQQALAAEPWPAETSSARAHGPAHWGSGSAGRRLLRQRRQPLCPTARHRPRGPDPALAGHLRPGPRRPPAADRRGRSRRAPTGRPAAGRAGLPAPGARRAGGLPAPALAGERAQQPAAPAHQLRGPRARDGRGPPAARARAGC